VATYVLSPGAGDSAWSWSFVATALRERGHDAIAVDLPCDDDSAGLTEYLSHPEELAARLDADLVHAR
jgi:alpha-beta hydrolase superfamily lysophospholipase